MGMISGKVGGVIRGYDISATVDSGVISGRIGGAVFGNDINLTYSVEEGYINGRLVERYSEKVLREV